VALLKNAKRMLQSLIVPAPLASLAGALERNHETGWRRRMLEERTDQEQV